jgi:hypothetical protein
MQLKTHLQILQLPTLVHEFLLVHSNKHSMIGRVHNLMGFTEKKLKDDHVPIIFGKQKP